MNKSVIPEQYKYNIQKRGKLKFLIGLISRLRIYFKFYLIRKIAILRGAKIGKNVNMPLKLALRANPNLIIGNDCIIETSDLDLRDKIIIKDHVIINKKVCIIRLSHYINDNNIFSTRYFEPLIIESYCWLATGCKILPSVNLIEEGAIIGAYSVVVKNVSSMDVVSGNPAKILRKHNSLFNELVVCSLQGGDLMYYINSYIKCF